MRQCDSPRVREPAPWAVCVCERERVCVSGVCVCVRVGRACGCASWVGVRVCRVCACVVCVRVGGSV